MSNFDFTDKAQESVAAAIQLAKDYANAQGKSLSLNFILPVEQYFAFLSSTCPLGLCTSE
jgi:hypothetical protein